MCWCIYFLMSLFAHFSYFLRRVLWPFLDIFTPLPLSLHPFFSSSHYFSLPLSSTFRTFSIHFHLITSFSRWTFFCFSRIIMKVNFPCICGFYCCKTHSLNRNVALFEISGVLNVCTNSLWEYGFLFLFFFSLLSFSLYLEGSTLDLFCFECVCRHIWRIDACVCMWLNRRDKKSEPREIIESHGNI